MKMSVSLKAETEAYLSRFYEPKVTAYEFLKCFFAFLKKKDISEVDRDLVLFLYNQKQNPENNDVLDEISFRSNGVSYYSDDIEDALFNLQNGGLLGKMNPSFGIIINKYTNEEANKIIDSVPEEYRKIIERIADLYENSKKGLVMHDI